MNEFEISKSRKCSKDREENKDNFFYRFLQNIQKNSNNRKEKNRKAQKILVLEGILKTVKHRFAEDFYCWNNES